MDEVRECELCGGTIYGEDDLAEFMAAESPGLDAFVYYAHVSCVLAPSASE